MTLLPLLACSPTTPSSHSGAPTDSVTTPGEPPVEFAAIGFNTESEGSVPETVAAEVIADMRGEGLWGFAEVVDEAAAALYAEAAHDDGSDQSWAHVVGTTGWSDRLVLAWDDQRFSLEDDYELSDINVGGTVRAPLVGRMRERSTDQEFLFVVNHLWRSEAGSRREQARLLNEWGAGQSLPILMVGDYNFDWDVGSGDHDPGYDELVAGGVFEWVRPDPLVSTQCSGFYDSVLDFVFVGGDAREWAAESVILRPDDTYCSGSHRDTWSDHRPVRADLAMPVE